MTMSIPEPRVLMLVPDLLLVADVHFRGQAWALIFFCYLHPFLFASPCADVLRCFL